MSHGSFDGRIQRVRVTYKILDSTLSLRPLGAWDAVIRAPQGQGPARMPPASRDLPWSGDPDRTMRRLGDEPRARDIPEPKSQKVPASGIWHGFDVIEPWSRFTRPRKVKAHAEQPGPRGPVGSYCIGPETRKAKGAATLVGYQISYVKGRVRRAVVSTIYLNRVRYRGRMTLTADTDRTQDVTHSQPQAGPHPRDTRRDPGSGSTDAATRTYTLAGSWLKAPGAGPVCRHPNRLLQRGTGTQRLVHNGQYSNSYSLGPPRRAALALPRVTDGNESPRRPT